MLGTSIQEESRTKIIGALWQYIKSNRLQESDENKYGSTNQGSSNPNLNLSSSNNSCRQIINANSQDLISIFGGKEQIQFHQIMEKLSNHLFEVQPVVFEFMIGSQSDCGSIQRRFFNLQVECFSESQQRQIDFLTKYNYEFIDTTSNPDEGP